MNERIKELAEQAASVLHEQTGQTWGIHPAIAEVFAELVVRECADTAYHFFYDDAEGQQISAREAILSKFEVE